MYYFVRAKICKIFIPYSFCEQILAFFRIKNAHFSTIDKSGDIKGKFMCHYFRYKNALSCKTPMQKRAKTDVSATDKECYLLRAML